MNKVGSGISPSIWLILLLILSQSLAIGATSTLFSMVWTMLERPEELGWANQIRIVVIGCLHYWGMIGFIVCSILATARRPTAQLTRFGRRVMALGHEIRSANLFMRALIAYIILWGGPCIGVLALGSTLWCQTHPWLSPIHWANLLTFGTIIATNMLAIILYDFFAEWLLRSAKLEPRVEGRTDGAHPSLYDRELDAA